MVIIYNLNKVRIGTLITIIQQAKMQVKNTEHNERSIKIKVMHKKHSSENSSTFQLRKHAHSILKCSNDKNYTTIIINRLDMHTAM